MPGRVREKLESTPSRHPDHVSKVLTDAVVAFDDSIAQDFLNLVPDAQTIAQMTDDQLRILIDDLEASPDHNKLLNRCMHGSTALIALLDPPKHNLWVASLGDCQAGMSSRRLYRPSPIYFASAWKKGRPGKVVRLFAQRLPQRTR